MKMTIKGQVTIPQEVREDMGLRPAESEVDFVKDTNGHWYLKKKLMHSQMESRFRKAHKAGQLKMTTKEIMALTRG